MSTGEATVFVVDDDASVRRGLERLLRSAGHQVATFASAREFLDRNLVAGPCCLVLDVRMPGVSGLELQEKLTALECDVPVIFITGNGDIPMVVRAMKAGAVDFLAKPFDDQELLDAVDQALGRTRPRRSGRDLH
ncbi:MAG TPA: response regulator transcription factor [Methylomirabilota bacterium]|jgi:FixJ family two-component response regulator